VEPPLVTEGTIVGSYDGSSQEADR